MKSMIKSLTFAALLMLTAFTSYAQRGGGRLSPEEMADRQTTQMTEHLELTDEQEKEVAAINLTYAKIIRDARKEAAGDRTALRTTMQSMLQDRTEALKEVLTEEQLIKLEEVRSQYGQRRQGNKAKDKKKGRKKDRKGKNKQDGIDQE